MAQFKNISLQRVIELVEFAAHRVKFYWREYWDGTSYIQCFFDAPDGLIIGFTRDLKTETVRKFFDNHKGEFTYENHEYISQEDLLNSLTRK